MQSVDDTTESDIEMDAIEQKLSDSTNSDECSSSSDNIYCIVDDIYVHNCEIKISDFGNSCYNNNKTSDEIQTRYYRAPEIILNCPYNKTIDIWSVGCIIYELLTGDLLFDPDSKLVNKDKHHLYWMEQLLGKIPQQMINKSKRKKYLFNKEGQLKNLNIDVPLWDLKNLLIEKYNIDKIVAEEISDFLLNLLTYDNTKRYSAKDCLKHKWLIIN
jgi:serine/threonine-protein kinase SRPK3